MKENNFNTTIMDADFDARCRTMLEESQVVAPEPRADLFADSAPKGAGMRWSKWGGAAIVLAGAAIWMWSADRDLETSNPTPGMEQVKAVDVEVSAEAEASLDQASVADTDAAVSNVSSSAENGGVSEPTSASTEVLVPSAGHNALASEERTSDVLQIETVEETVVPQPALTDLDAQSSGAAMPSEITSKDIQPVNPGGDTPPVEAPTPAAENLSETKATPERASAESPKLTLPLTLPSGGGQR